ncbi:flagellar hook-associated protein FlgL [Bacillus sp. V59.32b]|uniref:flagellar hook-associated protein FlgL n=1 Tax=Bacillus sp. V59.32b TaxID=1758642 RepID=UPI000E3E5A2F|nr:flagellar hook-associated protein FlgL [Bacillus sp. V59.32b]RFU67420.1 flagellar hook-associated protein FlgL [Bacillus sp. V59.32b]
MRVTQSMLSNNMTRNISNSYERLGKLQEQISSKKKFTKPSDDPVAAMQGLGYRTDLNRILQYQSNIGEVRNWVDSTDDALDKTVLALQKIRELTVQASNGTLDASQRDYITREIEQMKQQIQSLGDTEVGGKYIFNGTKTNQRPSSTGFSGGVIELEVYNGIKLQINTPGKQLFEPLVGDTSITPASPGYLDTLITKIKNDDNISAELANMDKHIDNFLSERASIGARQNRVDLMDDRLSQQEVFSTRILSNNEDIDIERAIIDLTTQESVHRAALGIGARIIQPSLMDFLR